MQLPLCSMSCATVPGPERPIIHPSIYPSSHLSTPAGVSKVHNRAQHPIWSNPCCNSELNGLFLAFSYILYDPGPECTCSSRCCGGGGGEWWSTSRSHKQVLICNFLREMVHWLQKVSSVNHGDALSTCAMWWKMRNIFRLVGK